MRYLLHAVNGCGCLGKMMLLKASRIRCSGLILGHVESLHRDGEKEDFHLGKM